MSAAWKVVGAAVQGAAHVLDGTPCQDAHAHRVAGDWLVAAVCDGAGSAALGGLGATVGAQAVVAALAQACGQAPPGPPGQARAFWHGAAIEAVQAARRAVERALAETDGGTDDRGVPLFERAHATLVAAVARPSGGLFVHIGDGLGAARSGGETVAVSPPANGAYANETYFFTESDWDGQLRLTPFGPPFDLVALMSDGAAAFATEAGPALHAGFWDPVSAFLDTADAGDARRALAETLGSEQADRVTGDDKTVLWARLAPSPDPPAG